MPPSHALEFDRGSLRLEAPATTRAGYWTLEYIADKLRRLGRVRGVNLIVAVPRAFALRAGELPATVLPFGRRVLLKDLLPRLEAFCTGKRRKRR